MNSTNELWRAEFSQDHAFATYTESSARSVAMSMRWGFGEWAWGQSPCGPTPDSGDSPRVGIFRRHPERLIQWAENRSVSAENNMSERGVRRTVIARKVCVRWTRASASLTCSSRCRHTRQNSVGDGRGPVAFRKSGEKPKIPFRQWKDPESRLRLRTRRLEKLRCTFAQMLRCRGRSRPR